MSAITDIDEFLAATLRALRAGHNVAWTIGAWAQWSDVWTRIELHGLPLLLHENRDHLAEWPRELIDRIAEEARLMVLWETTHKKVVCELLDALQDAEIDSVIMKGTALAYSLHEEPAVRRRGDTDLLIKSKHRERTREILRQLGWYRKPDPHGLNYQEGWLHDAAGFFAHAVDLHWEPSERAVLQSVLPLDMFFEAREALPALHEAANRPDWAMMVLHGVINQKWHEVHGYDAEHERLSGTRRLIWSIDFDLLASSMSADDWNRLVQHCLTQGVGPLVAQALRGVEDDLCTQFPKDELEQLENARLDRDVALYFSNLDGLSQFWLDLRKSQGLGAKLHLVRSRLLPPRGHLLEKYPAAQKWPTFALQGRMMIETTGRILRRTVNR